MRRRPALLCACVASLLILPVSLSAVAPVSGLESRLKDLASLEGVRDNQLIGYGLVVGLNGTGDKQQTIFSVQTLTNMLRRMGVTADPTLVTVHNIAGVMVTADLPPFAQTGTRIDITAAAIGDAKNLQGGLLLMTPLKAADGQVYAVAQGSIMTGGFMAGKAGNTQTVNHPTVGRLPGGAIVERTPPSISPTTQFRLQLHEADFTTASHVVEALNRRFASDSQPLVARAESSAVIVVDIPSSYTSRSVEFVADMENVIVEPDRPSRIVINERTGTIVMGKDVHIAPVAIMHGALNVQVRTTVEVSQPSPLAAGTTAVVQQTAVSAKEEKAKEIVLDKGATVEQLVRALQAIGSTPRDIIAILQNIRAAGALSAQIEVI